MSIYYVSKSGNDINPGTEPNPWKTISKAANTAIAGDTVIVKTGTYNERLKPVNSGTTGNYIKFISQGATIDTRNLTRNLYDATVYLCHLHWIWIEGFTIYPVLHERSIWMGFNDFMTGEGANSFSTNIMIRNNTIYGASSQHNHIHVGHYGGEGMSEGGNKNITIDGNILNISGSERDIPTMNPEMISCSYTDNCEVKYNQIYGSIGIGIDFKGGYTNGSIHHNIVVDSANQAIYLDGYGRWGANVEIYNNYISDIGPFLLEDGTPIPQPAINLGAEQGQNDTTPHLKEGIKIYNNVINKADVGILIGGGQGSNTVAVFQNIHVFNNTILNMTDWGICAPRWGINPPDLLDIYVRNNLMYNCRNGTEDNIYSRAAVTIIENNHYTNNSGANVGVRYTTGNPLFVNASNDFRLTVNSPCRNSGTTNEYPAFDFNDLTRDRQPDIGAYEYQDTLTPPTPIEYPININSVPLGASVTVDGNVYSASSLTHFTLNDMRRDVVKK